jgi:hypothetical protein
MSKTNDLTNELHHGSSFYRNQINRMLYITSIKGYLKQKLFKKYPTCIFGFKRRAMQEIWIPHVVWSFILRWRTQSKVVTTSFKKLSLALLILSSRWYNLGLPIKGCLITKYLSGFNCLVPKNQQSWRNPSCKKTTMES